MNNNLKRTNSMLLLNKMLLSVKIGVEDYERIAPKEIELYIRFYINGPIDEDDISKTICYGKVLHLIESHFQNQEFKLIEFLCYKIHQLLKSTYGEDLTIEVRIIKNKPFDNNKLKSAEFTYIG